MADSASSVRRAWARLVEPDMVVALSAVVIGLSALVVSVIQVQIMRQEQHASVWPRLAITKSYNSNGLGIEVINPGIGPAVVKHVRVAVDDSVQQSWPAALATLIPNQRGYGTYQSYISDRVVRAGEQVTTLTVAPGEAADSAQARLGRLSVEICYCSVYDRCWMARGFRGGSAAPEEVRACTIAESQRFRN